jgi:hypothetical protein
LDFLYNFPQHLWDIYGIASNETSQYGKIPLYRYELLPSIDYLQSAFAHRKMQRINLKIVKAQKYLSPNELSYAFVAAASIYP